jgi:S-DNA-T family DNA segregation ATPase FtsK/SpoIIIE
MKKTKKKISPYNDIKGFVLLIVSVLYLCSLFSFSPAGSEHNWLGFIGYMISLSSLYLFGLGSYLISFFLFFLGMEEITHKKIEHMPSKMASFLVVLISFCFLMTVIAEKYNPYLSLFSNTVLSDSMILSSPILHTYTRYILGGTPFYFLYADLPVLNLQQMLSPLGVTLIFLFTFVVFSLLLTGLKLEHFKKTAIFLKNMVSYLIEGLHLFIKGIGFLYLNTFGKLQKNLSKPSTSTITLNTPSKELPKSKPFENVPIILEKTYVPQEPAKETPKETPLEALKKKSINALDAIKKIIPEEKKENITPPAKKSLDTSVEQEIKISKAEAPKPTIAPIEKKGLFELPSLNLLTNPPAVDMPQIKKELQKQAEILEKTLLSFGIEAKVGEINCGPTITSFEVHPPIGVKVQKIKTLENDIALNLEAKSIRIIAPIPGKAAVGVEIPSLYPQLVSLKEMLSHYQQTKKKYSIPILLGKTVSGEHIITDLAKMPHLLIAGATGSGKSVCINTIVMSILMNATPDEVRLLMVDPKKVELTQYSDLPHMVAPVITEAHGAYSALQWLVKEMQNRYEILKLLGLRNITAFNTRKIRKDVESSFSIAIPEKMSFIVAIIDEFADLMMVSASDLETPIARIAQMARAVGIHLILATQRPSREVITGIIKANFPSRIAFKVSSRINSLIILDETGAESLLGNGDLLFLPPGSSHLVRAQGAYISDEDINKVIQTLSEKNPTSYLIPSFDMMKPQEDMQKETEGHQDHLYDQALTIVLSTRTASTTFLQRKLKIGYARAASLMDELESNGVISAQDGAKPRRILMSSQEDILE